MAKINKNDFKTVFPYIKSVIKSEKYLSDLLIEKGKDTLTLSFFSFTHSGKGVKATMPAKGNDEWKTYLRGRSGMGILELIEKTNAEEIELTLSEKSVILKTPDTKIKMAVVEGTEDPTEDEEWETIAENLPSQDFKNLFVPHKYIIGEDPYYPNVFLLLKRENKELSVASSDSYILVKNKKEVSAEALNIETLALPLYFPIITEALSDSPMKIEKAKNKDLVKITIKENEEKITVQIFFALVDKSYPDYERILNSTEEAGLIFQANPKELLSVLNKASLLAIERNFVTLQTDKDTNTVTVKIEDKTGLFKATLNTPVQETQKMYIGIKNLRTILNAFISSDEKTFFFYWEEKNPYRIVAGDMVVLAAPFVAIEEEKEEEKEIEREAA